MSDSNHITDILHCDIATSLKDGIGLHDHIAGKLAADVMKKLQGHWGGREIYIPVADSEERNAAVRAEFNSRNHADICRKHKISLRTLYRILE